MDICLINFDAVWKDTRANIAKKESLIQQALIYHPETTIVVFPELSLTGYILDGDAESLAEDRDGSSMTMMRDIAKRYSIHLLFGYIEKNPDGKPYNSAMLIAKDGTIQAIYKKNHLFTQGIELQIYTPGDSLTIFELEGWKCGISICFDLRYPRLYEGYKKAGVECVFNIAAWVDGRNKPDIFHSLSKSRSGENQMFMASIDCIGKDQNNSYAGNAIISNPYCEDIAETRDTIFHFAHLEKTDMIHLATNMPLSSGYREKYNISPL